MAAKKKTFSKVKAVKELARATVGEPKAARAIEPDKKKQGRGAKYKKSTLDWERGED